MTLWLLLAKEGDGRPVIETPLLAELPQGTPIPPSLPKPTHLYHAAAEADSLREQRWALVVSDDARGRRLESLLAPLCMRRSEEQGRRVAVHRAPPGLDMEGARRFVEEEVHPETRSRREHARYLLLAGGLESLSLELQEVLTGDGTSIVGRLAFECEEDYAAYAAKVVARERSAVRARKARAVFLSVQDESPQVRGGQEFIVRPAVQRFRAARRKGDIPASDIVSEMLPEGDVGRLLELAGEQEPSLLFSLSHGIGGSDKGWESAAAQRRSQGNMGLGAGIELTAEDARRRTFLPGGVWFYFACFGAGTPAMSVYQPWMERLVQARRMGAKELAGVHRSRPVDGAPFMAALPQAALANPEGPLAVIAHLDMAWVYAFHNARTGQSYTHRLEGTLESLMEGYRAGLALHSLTQAAWQVDGALRSQYVADDEARRAGREPSTHPAERAHLWMERHDVTSYVLLGDPAVRLVDRPSR
ncbi:hypothetical protein ACLESO_09245 [Pyxidicoccus sp. 3LG]